MNKIEKALRVINMEISELERLKDRISNSFIAATEIFEETLRQRGKIIVVGVGKSGHIGEKIAATLTGTGSTAVVLNSLNALHGDLGVVADGDAVLVLSYSGETEEITNLLPALARFNVKLICMTGNADSQLARSSDVVLDIHVEEEACPLKLAPTCSTTAMLVLGDALAMVLLEARGFKKEDFAKLHPGGRLGRNLLLKVHRIMRTGEQFVCVPPETPVRDLLAEMSRRRAGAAAIANGDGELAGIFTHGDFARHYQKNAAIGEQPVREVLTPNPVTVPAGALAAEVLQALQQHRIDDLVVVDEEGRPVGMVDSQDLARFKLL